MQIDGGRMLQKFILTPRCFDHVWMAMADADRHNSTERVKIPSTLFVEHILAFPLHDHQRPLVVEENSGIQKLAPQPQHFFRGWATIRLRLIIEGREFRCLHYFVLQTFPSPSANQRLVVTFCCVKNCTPSRPCICRSPKKESPQPEKGNQAIDAGTPMLMPTIPAFTRCLNSRAVFPERVKMEAPLPYGERLIVSIALSRSSARITFSTGPKISSRANVISLCTSLCILESS